MMDTIALLKDIDRKQLVEKMCEEANIPYTVLCELLTAALETQGNSTRHRLNQKIEQIIEPHVVGEQESAENSDHGSGK